MSEEGMIFGIPHVPQHYNGIEATLFRNNTICQFIDKIKQTDIEIAIRDLCLLGIEVFRDRNPTLGHYSLKEIQRCLHNFVEEKSVRDYYRHINNQSDEEYSQPNIISKSKVTNDQNFEEKESRPKTRSRSKNRSKSKHRNSNINNKTQSPRSYDTTPQHHDNNKSNYQMNSNQNMHDFRGSPKNENKKDEAYYYFRRPPTHSSVPVNPAEMHGPPPQVAPYFYYTDKDLEVLNGERDNRKVITTVSRPTDMFIGNSINKRVATSPLKSCIQNAEVKIARGGVAVSFDPWNDENFLNKSKILNQTSNEREFEQQFDHIPNEDELRISDAKYFNSLVKSIGINPKIDPKVQKLAQRDMEIAIKKRETIEIQRKNEKKHRHKSHARNSNKTRICKNQYRNVQSKIKHSVQLDRSRAREKSAYKSSRKEFESISRSPAHKHDYDSKDIRDVHERRISDRMIMMNRSFNDAAKSKECDAYSRVTTLHNPNSYTDEDMVINSHQREESTIEAQKLNKSASCIEPKGVSIKSLEVDNPVELANETKEPSVPQCGYKVYKPLRNPYNAITFFLLKFY